MTITWDDVGERVYETGVDHGILFLMDGTAVPWNGLTQVALNVSGGDLESYYFDGIKYMDYVLAEDFDATITAVTAPKEFAACEGVVQVKPGMSTPFQQRQKFGLCWRTRIANDVNESLGYKLHIAYNCTVLPTVRTYATIADTTSPDIRAWGIKTTPACGRISYYVFDSRDGDLTDLEAQLYTGNLPYCGSLAGLVGVPMDDAGCASLVENFEEYVNGQTFNPTTDVVDGLTETFLFGIVNPGIDEVDVASNTTFTVNDSAATEVGSGAILADDDDTTYVDSASGDLGYTFGLPPLVGYYPGADLELHIRMSISGDVDPDDPDNLDADAQVFITTDAAGDLPVGGFSDGTDEGMGFTLTDVGGNAVDYVVPLAMDAWTETTIEDVVAALQAGAYLNVVAVNNNNPDPALTPEVKVYELSVVMLDNSRIDKFLRADPDEVFCKIEQHVYETGTTDLEGANTTSIEFMVRKVPYLSAADSWYQELMFWDGSGPALFKVDSNGGQPRLQLVDEDTSSVLVNLIPLQNTWYKAEIYWTWGSYHFRLFQDNDRQYGPETELPYALTTDTTAIPIAFAEHIGGFVGESTGTTYEAVIDNAVLQTHCHEANPSVEHAMELVHTVPSATLGRSSSFSDAGFPETPGSTWTFSSNHAQMTFDFDQASGQSLYDLLASVDIVGWRIRLTVSAFSGTGPYRFYYNFAFDKPGEAQLPYDGIPGVTEYGPEDNSAGTYIDITGVGEYSLDVGFSPYSGSYANTPERILDRIRNDVTDAYGRVAGDSGFSGTYNHGYGTFEVADANADGGSITISELKVVFYT